MQPIFWLTGNYYEVKKRWNEIKKTLGDSNIIVMHCGYNSKTTPDICKVCTASDVIRTLKMKDLFDDRPRIIKMKGLPENYALLTDYLHLVNNKNVLVIDSAIGYWASPHYKKFVNVGRSKFYTAVKKHGKVFKFDTEPKQGYAISWIKKVFSALGRNYDSSCPSLLVEAKGCNLDVLYSEISRLLVYQPKGKISADSVKECCVPAFTKTVWELINGLDKMEAEKCLAHLQQFYEFIKGPDFQTHVESLFGALIQHFLFLLCIKDECGTELSDVRANRAIEGIKKRVKRDGQWKYDADLFTSQFVSFNIRKPEVTAANKWGKQKTYNVFRDLCRSRQICRMQMKMSVVKLCLDSFAMFACGKIDVDQAKMMRRVNLLTKDSYERYSHRNR